MRLHFLNHSSVLIDNGTTKLLTDPWLKGPAFNGGWQLEWENSSALSIAESATHLWISHPHSDHLHFESLKEIAGKNPAMTVLGVDNSLINMSQILRRLPFKNIVSLNDREDHWLDEKTFVHNVPSLAIDNILLYATDHEFIINVNDGMLSAVNLQRIVRKHPRLRDRKPDLVLINFSHAHKILEEEVPDLRKSYLERIQSFIDVFQPRAVVPIASFQLYTGDFAKWQNAHRVHLEELKSLDNRIHCLHPGDSLTISPSEITEEVSEARLAGLSPRQYQAPPSESELERGFLGFCQKLKSEFLLKAFLPRPLNVRFKDTASSYEFNFRDSRVSKLPEGVLCDMECNAADFHNMTVKNFGFDSFYVAADYCPRDAESARKVWKLIYIGCLADYLITPRNALRSIFSLQRWKFLWNRREQLARVFTMVLIRAE